ncbi:MAG TPA: alpha/beta family hydrolase [Caulobacteraceae bacterium]
MSAGVVPVDDGAVRGWLHEGEGRDGLILTHGAGSNCEAPLLVEVARVFAAEGVTVLRCDLAFRAARASGPPPRGSAAADQAGLRDAAAALRRHASGRIFLGGHSYGGRQASMLAADEPDLADGLLLLSYPLHPPKQPDKLRTEHLPRLRTPAVFVHGTADAFATSAELAAAVSLIPARTRVISIEGAGHDLRRGGIHLPAVVAALLQSA